MNRLWNLADYTERLSHPDGLIRRWAFKAIEEYYPRHFVKEVANLIGDSDEHLACVAPKYIAKHQGIEFAPKILECFINSSGVIAANCIQALRMMSYEDAYDAVLQKYSTLTDLDEVLGVIDYLGIIKTNESFDLLKNAFHQFKHYFFIGGVTDSILAHGNPSGIDLIFTHILKKDHTELDPVFKSLADAVSDSGLYRDIVGDYENTDIFKDPDQLLEDLIRISPAISDQREKAEKIFDDIINDRFSTLIPELVMEAKKTVQERYGDTPCPVYLEEMNRCDQTALGILGCLAEKPGLIKTITRKNDKSVKLLSCIIAIYFSVTGREPFIRASKPDASLPDLIRSLKMAGPSVPKSIEKRIIDMAPIADLQTALTDEWESWGDVHLVKLMGLIGNRSFIPDLIHILNNADPLSYILGEALQALQRIDDAGHPEILAAIQNGQITDPLDIMELLGSLPYKESYDMARWIWDAENDDDGVDSYEIYAHALERIGYHRGIDAICEILYEGNAIYVGNSLETLCLLHEKEIPELAMIHQQRKVHQEQKEQRNKDLFELGNRTNDRDLMALAGGIPQHVDTFKRSEPKVGRNDPCPCGSGKKYKKCCLK